MKSLGSANSSEQESQEIVVKALHLEDNKLYVEETQTDRSDLLDVMDIETNPSQEVIENLVAQQCGQQNEAGIDQDNPKQEEKKQEIINSREQTRVTGLISLAILCSRILGLVRDQLLNSFFGSSFAGIFLQAFRTPNMLRDLFAEGALSTAFVTCFSRLIKHEKEEEAWKLGRRMLSLALCWMSFVSVAGVLLAPWIIALLNPGWGEASQALCVKLAQIMYPFILLVSLTAIVMGMLNSKKVFFIPAIASAFFNIGCIVGGISCAWLMDEEFRKGEISELGLKGFAIGTLIGGVFQLLVQIPSLRKQGFRFAWDMNWRDQEVKNVLSLMWPSLLAASGTQISVLLSTIFTSYTPGKESASSWLSLAQRLQQLPLGLFGVAVATVTLPMLSKMATEGITEQFREGLTKGIRLVCFLTFPSAIVLYWLAEPIISILYQHGRYTEYDVIQTAIAMRAFAVGLIFYACIKVIQPIFFTINKRFVPMTITLVVLVFNFILNYLLVCVFEMGHGALAWTTALGVTLNFTLLFIQMNRYVKGLADFYLMVDLVRIGISSLALLLILVFAKMTLLAHWNDYLWIGRLARLLVTLNLAGVTYFLIAHYLKIQEAYELFSIVEKKLGRKSRIEEKI
jgi:putative peptidoglycan lipid II flippase